MIVFLKKVRVKTIFSKFEPVIVEPLELSYLISLLKEMNLEHYIIDKLFNLKPPKGKTPDIVVLTGYNVAEDEILKDAKDYKEKYPNVKTIVGGVHIQLNSEIFHSEYIDYVIHSQSLIVFKALIKSIIEDKSPNIKGVDYKIGDNWHKGSTHLVLEKEPIVANRDLYNKIRKKTRYLEKREVALIKGSIGCPYSCSYCFCKYLNEGKYIKADYESIAREIDSFYAKYYWIVDDVLFVTKQDAQDFILAMEKLNKEKKIIGYLRADFIIKEEDLFPSLKKAGLEEVIIGFEAINNEELEDYSKSVDALDYPKTIKILRENDIDLTALFIVKPDYGIGDFINLYKFIKKNRIEVFTLSILTPLKGTDQYEEEKMELATLDPRKFDFLHLVKRPKLPKIVFYTLFYIIHLRLLRSKSVLKYLFKKS